MRGLSSLALGIFALEWRNRKMSVGNAAPRMRGTVRAYLQAGLVLVCVAVTSAKTHAQGPQSAPLPATLPAVTSRMPDKPADIMRVAIATNGLYATSLSPWHLKATFQTFDNSTQPKSTGTFEEFWASPTKFKRILTTATSSETEFGTDHGYYRTGSQDWPDKAEILLDEKLMEPVPAGVNLLGLDLKKKQISVGSVHLECVTLESAGKFVSTSVYCFAQDEPILRLTVASQGRVQTEYDNLVLFDGRYVGRDVRVVGENGKLSATVHINVLEPMPSVPDSEFLPVAGTTSISEPVPLAQATAASLVLLQAIPAYPQFAKTTGVQGDVLLDVSVDRNGQVENAQVISGPADLQDVSLRAVRNWKYETSLIFGQPVAFHTQVKVIFTLGSQ